MNAQTIANLYHAPSARAHHLIARLADYARRHWGLATNERRLLTMFARLQRGLKNRHIDDVEEYLESLTHAKTIMVETPFLVDLLTTHTTSFFREQDHFEFIQQVVFPECFATGKNRHGALKIWSAACSTGQEPYTAAMVCAEATAYCAGMNYSILASDISDVVLDHTKQAVYPENDIRLLPSDFKRRYFLQSRDPLKQAVRVKKELRDCVQTKRINLVGKYYDAPYDFDVILLRNCLIYFELATQHAVINRIRRHLRPGGYLITGHSEHYTAKEIGMQAIRPSIYRNSLEAAS